MDTLLCQTPGQGYRSERAVCDLQHRHTALPNSRPRLSIGEGWLRLTASKHCFAELQAKAIDRRGLVATYSIDTLLCRTPGLGYQSERAGCDLRHRHTALPYSRPRLLIREGWLRLTASTNCFAKLQAQAIDRRGLVATYGIDTLLCQTPGPGYRSERAGCDLWHRHTALPNSRPRLSIGEGWLRLTASTHCFAKLQAQGIDRRGLVATYGIDTLLCQTPGPGYRSERAGCDLRH